MHIGIDFDGTLSTHGVPDSNSVPIKPTVELVKCLLCLQIPVKIITARACSNNPERDEHIKYVQDWCLKNIGQILPVTAEKDYEMVCLIDDRAVTVHNNTGILASDDQSYGVMFIKSIIGEGRWRELAFCRKLPVTQSTNF